MVLHSRRGGLPVELYRPIFEGVERCELFKLVTVSRISQLEAERLVWRHIKITQLYKGIERICHCLLKIPRVWRQIEHLEIHQDGSTFVEETGVPTLNALLRKLGNLKALGVEGGRGWIPAVFQNCTFRLRSLRCDFRFDSELVRFLENQPWIVEFDWNASHSANEDDLLPSSTLPNLTVLTVKERHYRSFPAEIISNRPITHFRTDTRRPELIQNLLSVSAPVKALHIGPVDFDQFLSIANMFPLLEYLSTVNLHVTNVDVIFSDILPSLHHLRFVEVTQQFFDVEDVTEEYEAIVWRLYRSCPSLRLVGLGQSVGRIEERYEWKNDVCEWILSKGATPDAWRDSVAREKYSLLNRSRESVGA